MIPAINVVTVVNPGAQSVAVKTPVSLQIAALDTSPLATLTYAATNLPAGLVINAATGLISGTPTKAATNAVTVKVTDNTGVSASASFTMSVVNGAQTKKSPPR